MSAGSEPANLGPILQSHLHVEDMTERASCLIFASLVPEPPYSCICDLFSYSYFVAEKPTDKYDCII